MVIVTVGVVPVEVMVGDCEGDESAFMENPESLSRASTHALTNNRIAGNIVVIRTRDNPCFVIVYLPTLMK